MAAIASSCLMLGCVAPQSDPIARSQAVGAGCSIDDGSDTASYDGDDIAAAYQVVADAVANGTAIQPPDSQTIPLLDGTPEGATGCEGCSDVVVTGPPAKSLPPDRHPDVTDPSVGNSGGFGFGVADAVGAPKKDECNCPKTSWAFGNWGKPSDYGLDPCGTLPMNMRPFLFKPYTNACKNDSDCKKLLAQAMENCQKILEILKDQEAGKNTGICQQTQATRDPSFGSCEITALKDLGCTNGGKSGDVWKCPATNKLPPAPCKSMTDFCGKTGGFVGCASDMWNRLNADDIKNKKKKSCDYKPAKGNSC